MGGTRRPLGRDAIKLIAIVCMTFNHIAHAGLIPRGTVLFEVFEDIGYVTAITMCLFLVEGWDHTRDRRKYALRLLAFAVLAQPFYAYAFDTDSFDMLFTLFLCAGILWALDRPWHPVLRGALAAVLAYLTIYCDWPLIIAVATILFRSARGRLDRQILAYATAALLLGMLTFTGYQWQYPAGEAAVHAVFAALPMGVSAVMTLGLYDRTAPVRRGGLSRWAFYAYYPAHLAVLCLIKACLITARTGG